VGVRGSEEKKQNKYTECSNELLCALKYEGILLWYIKRIRLQAM
jgi:hypothetical protein